MSQGITATTSPETALEKIAINMLKQKLEDALIRQVAGLSSEKLAKPKNKV